MRRLGDLERSSVRLSILPARGAGDLAAVRMLFREYADGLGVDLAFQGFEAEWAGLPGAYAPPAGDLLIARGHDGEPLGCVGLRPLSIAGACEVKRLYVRAAARGTGAGRALANAAAACAARAGYRRMMLDTLPSMGSAISLYRTLGFEQIPPYGTAVVPGMLFFAKRLEPT